MKNVFNPRVVFLKASVNSGAFIAKIKAYCLPKELNNQRGMYD